jgi:protein-serine/threonine kinase
MYSSIPQGQQQPEHNSPGASQPTSSADIYAQFYGAPFPPIRSNNVNVGRTGGFYHQASNILAGGTVLHKGFYDLLSMIPTPASASRFWASLTPDPLAGPRYEDQVVKPGPGPGTAPAEPPKQVQTYPGRPTGRRITKDMVSHPTGFVYALSSLIRQVDRDYPLQ